MAAAMVATLRGVLTDGSEVTSPAPRWRALTALLLSVAGLGVSVYLTVDHFAKVPLVCSDTGVVNCQKVTTSAQSHFLGIPVAVLGLAFYLAMTLLNLPQAWRALDRRVHLARLVLSLLGIAFVLYLVAAELLIIGNICLWCTSVHVLTFLLLVLVVATVPPMLGWGTAPVAPVASAGRRRSSANRPGGRPGSSGEAGARRNGGGRGGSGRGGGRAASSSSRAQGSRGRAGGAGGARPQGGNRPGGRPSTAGTIRRSK